MAKGNPVDAAAYQVFRTAGGHNLPKQVRNQLGRETIYIILYIYIYVCVCVRAKLEGFIIFHEDNKILN